MLQALQFSHEKIVRLVFWKGSAGIKLLGGCKKAFLFFSSTNTRPGSGNDFDGRILEDFDWSLCYNACKEKFEIELWQGDRGAV